MIQKYRLVVGCMLLALVSLGVSRRGDIAAASAAAQVAPAESSIRAVLETRKDDFRRAVIRKVLSYALGRGIQGYDKAAIDQIVASVKADGDTFNSVILNVVKSFPFQNARGSAVIAAATKPVPKSKTGLQPVSLSVGENRK